MSSRVKRLKARPAPVVCESCRLPFATDGDLQMHYKNLREGRVCLTTAIMQEVLGFYRSRGSWRLGKAR